MEAPYSHKLDADAYRAVSALPANPFHKFVRHDARTLEAEQQAFEEDRHCPLFTYPEAQSFDASSYLEQLDRITNDLPTLCHHHAVVEDLYLAKLDELKTRALLIQAVQQKDDETVTRLSENLFSTPLQTRAELEQELQDMLAHTSTFFVHEKSVDRSLFIKMVQTVLDHYGMNNWVIGTTPGSSIKIKHGQANASPKILIPKDFQITKNRAMRLLAHEIEVHALRTTNGKRSPLLLLGRGLDRYIETEEGLAIYFQRRVKEKMPDREPGFWDAYATSLTMEMNFVQVYDTLRKARADVARKAGNTQPETKGRDTAWRLCIRAYRGIHNTGEKGVGYRRDHIYRSGLFRVRTALDHHEQDLLPTLFTGNIGLKHVERVKRLNLPTARQPELIARDVVQSLT